MNTTKVFINGESDVITVRMQARQMAKQIGFGTVDQARISLAASELARLACATLNQAGEMVISDANQEGQQGMQVVCLVNMAPKVDQPQTDDTQTATILSEQLKFRRGLASVSRLVDESVLELGDDGQASVTLIKWSN